MKFSRFLLLMKNVIANSIVSIHLSKMNPLKLGEEIPMKTVCQFVFSKSQMGRTYITGGPAVSCVNL